MFGSQNFHNMDFQFIIPAKNSDLENSKGDNYYVKQVYDPSEIPEQLKICRQAASSQDTFYIFDHFDTYFSVIENSSELSAIQLLRAFDLLHLTAGKLNNDLTEFFKNDENVNGAERNSYSNLTKMVLFVYIGTVKAIDTVILKAQGESGQLKKSKKVDVEGFDNHRWEEKKYNFLLQLYDIIQLPLEKLWSPPVAEENFVNLFCDVCYLSLEIPYSKEKKVCDIIFHILGTAIKRYNHALTFPVRILQILQSDKAENAIIPISRGVFLLYEEFEIQTIFSVLVKDIIDTLNADSNVTDTLTAKNFSAFLIEFTNVASKLIIPHISLLAEELLNLDSYFLRSSILQIIGDVILSELTSEELSDDLKELRDEILEDLLTHVNDVNSNVRSKILQIWNHLKEENAVPLVFQNRVLQAAVERLEDKTIPVRKNAVILIKSFLERNPFAPKLTLAELTKQHEEESEKMEKLREIMAERNKKADELDQHWETIIPTLKPILEETLKEGLCMENRDTEEDFENIVSKVSTLLQEERYKEAIILLRKADHNMGHSELTSKLNLEELSLYFMTLLRSYLFTGHGCRESDNEEFKTQENTLKFLEDCLEFSKTITKAIPKIQEMLMSKSNSDVFEAVNFFTTAFLFGIKDIEIGMKNMLYLIWSGDKEKRDSVINAYKKIIFTTEHEGRAHAIKVIQNLSSLIADLSYGQYSALEIVIKEWVASEDIDKQMIQVLFEMFTMKLEGISENQSRLALQLLVVASSMKPSIATANLELIENIGLGERGTKDPRIYSNCLRLILNTIPSDLATKFYKRYDSKNPLVEKVLNIFKQFFILPSIENFDNITEETIEFFYHFCQEPDIISQNLIIDIHKKMKEILTKISLTEECQTVSDEMDATQESQQAKRENKIIPTFLLTRFIFLIGLITMKEMIFLDIDVYNNMKFRDNLKEIKDNIKKKIRKRRTIQLEMSASASLKRLSGSAVEPQQEPDEDLVGAIAEDNIAELINYICEDELLYSKEGILPVIIPLVVEICKYPAQYKDEHLQQASTLTLIRLMAVSSKFCEQQMPFIMNILQLSNNIKIKCNIIVGLSDLTFRFPNVIDPWTGHIFSTLHESNDEIRLTSVKMISHLILNEMIRVKGQISDLAICIIDKNNEIRHMTQEFFKELGNKPNILYNVLPDIISKLSDPNLNLEEDKYRTIMKYILGLIQKDRQIESLVEKLCLRFKITHEERQWRDIAYCLSLLNYSEKSIKKLADNIQHFKDKLVIDEVYQFFKAIISNTSKLAKPELKTAVTEFENRLTECLQANDNDNEEHFNNSKNLDRPMKNQVPPRIRRNQQRRKQRSSSSESSSSDVKSPSPVRARGKKIQMVKTTEVIEESESTDDSRPLVKRNKRGRQRF